LSRFGGVNADTNSSTASNAGHRQSKATPLRSVVGVRFLRLECERLQRQADLARSSARQRPAGVDADTHYLVLIEHELDKERNKLADTRCAGYVDRQPPRGPATVAAKPNVELVGEAGMAKPSK